MDAKMNQSDLIALLAKGSNISMAKAELFTKNFFELIIEGLEQDGIVKINGLGTFKVTEVASRGSVNVNTGEKIEIKGHKKLVFVPADALKDCVNQPFAMFEPVEVDEAYQPEATAVEAENDEPAEEVVEETAAPTVTDEPVVEEIPVEVPEIEEQPVEEPVITNEPETEAVVEAIAEHENVAENKNIVAVEEQNSAAEAQQGVVTVVETDSEPIVVQERPAEPVMVRVPKKKEPVEVRDVKNKKPVWIYAVIAAIVIMVFYLGNTNTSKVDTQKENNITENVAINAGTGQTTRTGTSVGTSTSVAGTTVPATDLQTNVGLNVIAETIIEEPIVANETTENVEPIQETILETTVEDVVATNEATEVVEPVQETMVEVAAEETFATNAEPAVAVQDTIAVAVVEEIIVATELVEAVPAVQDTVPVTVIEEVVAIVEVAEPVQETNAVVVEETSTIDEPYKFVMVEELALKKLKDITLDDTTLYVADGDLAVHTVALDETLTKIARAYYGDKKLWPYIVKYNNMDKPDALRTGMEIRIPRLVPNK